MGCIGIPEHCIKEMAYRNCVLKDADDKCPFPYTKLDCTIEEFVELTGAISLDDFMRKMSDKHGISNDSTECEQ